MQYSSSKGSQDGIEVWVDVGLIDGVTVGMGIDIRSGVPVADTSSGPGSGGDMVVGPGSTSDALEQLVVTINNNNNNRFIKLRPKRVLSARIE